MNPSYEDKDALSRNQTTSESEDTTFSSLIDRVRLLETAFRAGHKPWYRLPSNVISVAAVIVTLAIFVVTFYANKQLVEFDKRQSLSSVIEEISALTQEEVQIAESSMSERARLNSQTGIANRRVSLVRKADALLAEVPDGASKLDMTILAAAYASIGRLEEAEKYYLDLAQSKSEPTDLRLMALRSLISLYTWMGEERIADAKEAYEAGMELVGSPDTPYLTMLRSTMPVWLSELLLAYQRYDDAVAYIITAERAAWSLPCLPYRNDALNLIESQVSRLLIARPDSAATLNAERANYPEGCTLDPTLVANGSSGATSRLGGTYVGPEGSLIIDRKQDGKLFVRIPGKMSPSPLHPLGKEYYSVVNVPNVYLSFQKGSTGDANTVHLVQPNRVFVLERSID